MWIDSASDIDMLFYEPYAKLISNIARNKNYNPVTIGIFGLWGAGKSTLLNLIEKDIEKNEKIICVSINAWMFEGYEDAKIALMETLLNELDNEKHKSLFKSAEIKVKDLFKRINYFKLGTDLFKKGVPIAASIAMGNPVPLLISMPTQKEELEDIMQTATKGIQAIKENYIKDKEESTVENIRAFKNEFEKMLEESDVDNVVVLIDDLDRCNPERILETLEAIKLFLSVKGTTFIIAADETVIEYAIKKKYPQLEGSQVILSDEYIEKIIQLPITIPDLSSKDIENYLLLLIAQIHLNKESFSLLLDMIAQEKLAIRESGISLTELNQLIEKTTKNPFVSSKQEYDKDSQMIDGIKDIISTNLKGNPRQTKRFLNTFVTKKELAQMYYGDDIDLKILTKLLVLQKISPDLFIQLSQWNREFITINEDLKDIYEKVVKDETEDEKYAQWRTPALVKWLNCEPTDLYKYRLDKYFYLTRENLKKSSVFSSELLAETKNMLEKIGNSSEANIDAIVDYLNSNTPQVINETISFILLKFNEQKFGMYIIKTLYIKCESYREKIVETLRNYSHKYELQDVPYFKSMLKIDPQRIENLLKEIRGNSLPVRLYDKIMQSGGKQ